jgi:AcrR family transcriptional regulator
MDESRRERKKRQTRRLIAETAIRLFGERGYEQTTVAQIAQSADVATKTFFNYFPAKEDVLFTDFPRRTEVALQAVADRRPGEGVADVLTRLYDAMLADFRAEGVGGHDPRVMQVYTDLVMTVPALQAKALHLAQDLQRIIAAALQDAFPDELDAIDAAAVVGAMVGAIQGAALASMERGDPEQALWEAMRRGLAIGLRSTVTGEAEGRMIV